MGVGVDIHQREATEPGRGPQHTPLPTTRLHGILKLQANVTAHFASALIVQGMRRWWWLVALLLLLGAMGGFAAYQRHHEVQVLGQEVYKELDGDGFPPLPGVLDDPVFRDLPPPPADQPVSLGRYKPKEEKKEQEVNAAPAPKVAAPKVSAPETPASDTSASPVKPPDTTAPTPLPSPPPTTATPSASTTPQPQSAPAPVNLAPTSFLERVRTNVKIHVLLMGNDQVELDKGRADVLVVLTFDPRTRTLSFLSVPRDTRVQIPEHEMAKINAAYAIGGPTLQTMAVEQFLGIPMDKFVEISMGGFQKVIDLVGGVTVNPPFAFTLDGQSFTPGPVNLNGEQALAYSRMRKEDPRGDLGRNARQQEVLQSLMGSLGRLSPEELNRLLGQLQNHLRTNFSPSEVVELRQRHYYLLTRQNTLDVQGVGRMIGGAWYYVVSPQERQRLHLLLR